MQSKGLSRVFSNTTVQKHQLKKKFKTPCDPAIPLLGIYPEETKTERDTCTPMFIAALFTIARTWKKSRCPLTDERLWRKGNSLELLVGM